MKLPDHVEEILETRYYLKNEKGEILEDWEKLCQRNVDHIFKSDKKFKDEAFTAMKNREFLPNSPCLVAAGREDHKGSFFACYTFGMKDTMKSIMDTCTRIAIATQRGGGTGFNLSNIRPKDASVSSNHRNALGPCKVLELFSKTGEVLTQNGFRDSAMMAMLDVYHPDIMEFINFKKTDRICENVNLTVIVDNAFMTKAARGEDYQLMFNGKPYNSRPFLNASEVLKAMSESAHACGDPGIAYHEAMFENTPHIEPLVSTNPCFTGETLVTVLKNQNETQVPIKDIKVGDTVKSYDTERKIIVYKSVTFSGKTKENTKVVCNTISSPKKKILVYSTPDHKFAKQDFTFSTLSVDDFVVHNNELSLELLEVTAISDVEPQDVYDISVSDTHCFFANNILVHNCGEFVGEDNSICCLGSINLNRCLTNKLDIDYDKFRSLIRLGVRFLDNVIDTSFYPTLLNEKIMKKYRNIGLGVMGYADILIKKKLRYGTSESLKFTAELFSFFQEESHKASEDLGVERGVPEDIKNKSPYNRRNLRVTVQAPTGTLARIAESSFGIEPVFALNYGNKLAEITYNSVYPLFANYCKENNIDFKTILDNKDLIPHYFVTSHDLSYSTHIQVMSEVQKHFDNAISKTINMSEEATFEDIYDAYVMGWNMGCKGLTIYRNNSLASQTILFDKESECTVDNNQLYRGEIKTKPDIIFGSSSSFQSSCGKVNVNLNQDEHNNPLEVFVSTKGGGCDANIHGLAILTSICLRAGVPLEEITKRMKKVKCSACIAAKARNTTKVNVLSCPSGIVECISKLNKLPKNNTLMNTKSNTQEVVPSEFKQRCPKCGEPFDKRKLSKFEGCVIIPCENQCTLCN